MLKKPETMSSVSYLSLSKCFPLSFIFINSFLFPLHMKHCLSFSCSSFYFHFCPSVSLLVTYLSPPMDVTRIAIRAVTIWLETLYMCMCTHTHIYKINCSCRECVWKLKYPKLSFPSLILAIVISCFTHNSQLLSILFTVFWLWRMQIPLAFLVKIYC